MKLFEVPLEAAQIEEELHAQLGELTPELQQRIANFVSQGKDKIEAAAIVVKSMEADADILKQEAQRMLQRSASLMNSADRLKGLILFAVDEGFGGKVRTVKFTIWGQNSAAVTHFDLRAGADIHALMSKSPELIRAPQPELDKVALKEAFKAGTVLPEEIVIDQRDGTRYLRIK